MSDKFDRYREALVVETTTVWPEDLVDLVGLDDAEKTRVEQFLHGDAKNCVQLEYMRMHTGFCRQITVTKQDMERAQAGTA